MFNKNKKENLLTIKNLKIEGLTEHGWGNIANNINFTLNRGEVLGIIGESGAGKSSIGLACMNFARDGCRISKGDIIFDGINLRLSSDSEKRRIRGTRMAYVAQSAAASFNPSHKLLDQFSEAAIDHKILSRKQARIKGINLFQNLDLPDPSFIGDRWPHQVSGGQLQRMMVAMLSLIHI